MSQKETVTIPLRGKVVNLHFTEFGSDVDVDELCRIDYSNMYAELITISSLMNRVGLWKAEADNAEQEARLERDVVIATAAERIEQEELPKKLTGPQMTKKLDLDPVVMKARRVRLRKGKEAAYLDSLYWAVKSKEKKVGVIGEKMNLTPEEFENNLIEGVWNGILINTKKKLI